MAKQIVVKKGVETLFTFLSPKGFIYAILANGERHGKSFTHNKWTHLGTKKADITLADWIAKWRDRHDAQPKWAQGVSAYPTLRTMERWSNDGIAKTVDGQSIEPDGTAANGAPSWLLVVGVI